MRRRYFAVSDSFAHAHPIKPDFPLEIQVKEGSDAHDYLDSPLCWIEVGLHRFHEERDDRFLTQLSWEFKIINSFWGSGLRADLESSLEAQQRCWKILEYRVIDEGTCTWVAKARRVYSLDAPEEEARVQVLLVRGFQSLVLDERAALSPLSSISYSRALCDTTPTLGRIDRGWWFAPDNAIQRRALHSEQK